ncbi:hypothetical protein [Bacillus horti]|uniref:Uncharacterized protein n=1 Tax=Caldalkalibacillus horti TaxID=77523 RepID=A0ABT9VXA8_9BACI|nr:hypothetical protein [Bacillus horti]MDQ0165530.1 hypothetical protein [Bacillus horti]
MNDSFYYLSKVRYKDEVYRVVWIYDSGLCEIKSANEKVILVNLQDVQLEEES